MKSKMRHHYLVLGGTGFIGSHLVDALAADGHFVRVLARPASANVAQRWPNPRVELVIGDFNDRDTIERVVRGCDVVFHLVSTTLPKSSNENPLFDLSSNVGGTIQLLDAVRKHGVRKVVFASSGGTIYGRTHVSPIPEDHATDPTCSHGIGKLAIEKYLQLYKELHGIDYCSLRIANPYGEGQRTEKAQGAIGVLLERVLNGRPFEIWGDGSVVRDYIHVSDVVRALIAGAAATETASKVFNIGTGRGTSLSELVDVVERAIGRRAQRIYLPARGFDISENVLDTVRATEELGWTASVSLDDGIRRTIEWRQESPRQQFIAS
jgi:UDP-glucose 4-epimerase